MPVVAALIAIGLAAAPTKALAPALSQEGQRTVREATVLLLPARCAGVVVGEPRRVITAAHCVGGERTVEVQLYGGKRFRGEITRVLAERDLAVIRLNGSPQVQPLHLAERMPRIGEALYFGGRRDRKGSDQVFAVLRIGVCPSLPSVDNAIFTNLRARPGDSGAPLVNKALEVVALVHGGARCNIAAPTIGFRLGPD